MIGAYLHFPWFRNTALVPDVPMIAPILAWLGASLSASLAAPGALSHSASGLPGGLSLGTSGLLSGTPTAIGDTTVTVTATNANGSITYQVIIIIEDPAALSVPLPLSLWPSEVPQDTTGTVANAQALLNANGAVRLKANFTYSGTLIYKSGQRVYGSGSLVTMQAEAGCTGAFIAGCGGTQTQAGDAARCVFMSTWGLEHNSTGRTTRNISIDSRNDIWNAQHQGASDALRWTRSIKRTVQGSYVSSRPSKPCVSIRGKTTDFGNSLHWLNLLTPQFAGIELSGLPEFMLGRYEVERYAGGAATGILAASIGALRGISLTGSWGTDGRAIDAAGCNLLLCDAVLYTTSNDLLRTDGNALALNYHQNYDGAAVSGPPALLATCCQINGDTDYPLISRAFKIGGVTVSGALSSAQAATIRTLVCRDPRYQSWEDPTWDPVPPAVAAWSGQSFSRAGIQAQINAAAAAGGGTVLLQPGIYYLDAALVLPVTVAVPLQGYGPWRTYLVCKDNTFDALTLADDGNSATHFVNLNIRDITVQGGRSGLVINHSGYQINNPVMSQICFRDQAQYGINFLGSYAWDNTFLDRLQFINQGLAGFRHLADHYGSDSDPTLCYIDKTVWYRCQFDGAGIAIDSTGYRACGGNMLYECRCNTAGGVTGGNRAAGTSGWRAWDNVSMVRCAITGCTADIAVWIGALLQMIDCLATVASGKVFVNAGGLTLEGLRVSGAGTLLCAEPDGITYQIQNVQGARFRPTQLLNCDIQCQLGELRAGMAVNSRWPGNAASIVSFYDHVATVRDSAPSDAAPRSALCAGAPVTLRCDAPVFASGTATLPNGTAGVAMTPWVVGVDGPALRNGATTLSAVSGALPAGVTLSAQGIISGTPSAGGTWSVIIRATNPAGMADLALSGAVNSGIALAENFSAWTTSDRQGFAWGGSSWLPPSVVVRSWTLTPQGFPVGSGHMLGQNSFTAGSGGAPPNVSANVLRLVNSGSGMAGVASRTVAIPTGFAGRTITVTVWLRTIVGTPGGPPTVLSTTLALGGSSSTGATINPGTGENSDLWQQISLSIAAGHAMAGTNQTLQITVPVSGTNSTLTTDVGYVEVSA